MKTTIDVLYQMYVREFWEVEAATYGYVPTDFVGQRSEGLFQDFDTAILFTFYGPQCNERGVVFMPGTWEECGAQTRTYIQSKLGVYVRFYWKAAPAKIILSAIWCQGTYEVDVANFGKMKFAGTMSRQKSSFFYKPPVAAPSGICFYTMSNYFLPYLNRQDITVPGAAEDDLVNMRIRYEARDARLFVRGTQLLCRLLGITENY